MMYERPVFLFCCLLISSLYISCKQKVDTPGFESYKNYYPLRVGKFITYKLDSTVLKNFGYGFAVKTYTVKDSVEEKFQDNLNRTSYRMVRYELEGGHWIANNTFTVTPAENRLEYVENNLRIIELVNPLVEGKN